MIRRIYLCLLVVLGVGCVGADGLLDDPDDDVGAGVTIGTEQEAESAWIVPQCMCACGVSPIIMDLYGDNYALTDVAGGVHFDIRNDGTKPLISWTATGAWDGFLVLDRNGNGTIDNGGELFGTATPQYVAPSGAGSQPEGFNALYAFDLPAAGGNNNGYIDAGDAVWSVLQTWVDLNHNGISESWELFPLATFGITSIQVGGSPGAGYNNSLHWTDGYGNQYWFAALWQHTVAWTQAHAVNTFVWDIYFSDQMPFPMKDGLCSPVGGTPPPATPPLHMTGVTGPWPGFGCRVDMYQRPKTTDILNEEICSGKRDPVTLAPRASAYWYKENPNYPKVYDVPYLASAVPPNLNQTALENFIIASAKIWALRNVARAQMNADFGTRYAQWCTRTENHGFASSDYTNAAYTCVYSAGSSASNVDSKLYYWARDLVPNWN